MPKKLVVRQVEHLPPTWEATLTIYLGASANTGREHGLDEVRRAGRMADKYVALGNEISEAIKADKPLTDKFLADLVKKHYEL